MLVRLDTEKLRRLREEAFMSREDLSRTSRISVSNIRKLEASGIERDCVRITTARALCKSLGVSVEELAVGVVGSAGSGSHCRTEAS
jgi:DNA-binding XRE family transcriptional regulator